MRLDDLRRSLSWKIDLNARGGAASTRLLALLLLLGVGVVLLHSDATWSTGAVTDYTGRAFFQPQPIGTPDTSVVIFPQALPDDSYTIVTGGSALPPLEGGAGVFYRIYLDAHVILNTQSPNGFTLIACWTAYVDSGNNVNRVAAVPVGSWNNRLAMLRDLGWVGPLPIEPHVDWRVVRSQ